jgi:putative glycosyl hydrolase
LPGLTNAERAALRAAMGAHSAGTRVGPPVPFVPWEHRAEPGLHGPADPGGGWTGDAFDVVRRSKVRAVKVLVPDVQASEVAQLRQINPDMFIVARLFSDQLDERRPQGGDGTPEAAGTWFANEVANDRDRTNPLSRAVGARITFFEVHNEPNLTKEGLGANWRDGAEFARFFVTVVNDLKPRFPNAKFGFPGLSPGSAGVERPIEMNDFLRQAQAAIPMADFVCCHVYWGNENVDLQGAIGQLRDFCAKFPSKKIICSEFSNNKKGMDRDAKAKEYARFYQACKDLPPNLGAMFAYVLSWRADDHDEGFLKHIVEGDHDFFQMTAMADMLGSESF